MMPWFPRDFASSTIGWPLVAKGAYRELLDAQWEMGRLPIERRDLRRICGASESEWRRVWPLLEPKFPIQDGFRSNLKLESHREKSLEIFEKRKHSSQIANAARWGNDPQRIRDGSHQSQSQYINPKNLRPLKSGSPAKNPRAEKENSDAAIAMARIAAGLAARRDEPDEEIPF